MTSEVEELLKPLRIAVAEQVRASFNVLFVFLI